MDFESISRVSAKFYGTGFDFTVSGQDATGRSISMRRLSQTELDKLIVATYQNRCEPHFDMQQIKAGAESRYLLACEKARASQAAKLQRMEKKRAQTINALDYAIDHARQQLQRQEEIRREIVARLEVK